MKLRFTCGIGHEWRYYQRNASNNVRHYKRASPPVSAEYQQQQQQVPPVGRHSSLAGKTLQVDCSPDKGDKTRNLKLSHISNFSDEFIEGCIH